MGKQIDLETSIIDCTNYVAVFTVPKKWNGKEKIGYEKRPVSKY